MFEHVLNKFIGVNPYIYNITPEPVECTFKSKPACTPLKVTGSDGSVIIYKKSIDCAMALQITWSSLYYYVRNNRKLNHTNNITYEFERLAFDDPKNSSRAVACYTESGYYKEFLTMAHGAKYFSISNPNSIAQVIDGRKSFTGCFQGENLKWKRI